MKWNIPIIQKRIVIVLVVYKSLFLADETVDPEKDRLSFQTKTLRQKGSHGEVWIGDPTLRFIVVSAGLSNPRIDV